ncbi:MAG TPA: SurA N-terminal domain-containing protein [Nakamurella sp.]
MRTSRQRLLLSTLAVAVVLLTATACATSATSAAIVGDVSIAEQTVFERTSQVSDEFGQTGGTLTVEQLAYVNRVLTTDAIRSALLASAAQDQGVVVTDAQVNAAMVNTATGSTGSRSDAQTYRDQLLLEGLLSAHGAEALSFTNVTVTVDGARTSSHDEAVVARTAIRGVPAGGSLPDLGPAVEPLQRTTVDLSTAQNPLLDGVLTARPGDVLINPSADGQYYVIRVVDRSDQPSQLSATAILGAQDLAVQRQIGAVVLLQRYAESVGVSVNPRMGRWDPVSLQVVASDISS